MLGNIVGAGPGEVGDPLGVGLSEMAGDGVSIGAAVTVELGDGSANARSGEPVRCGCACEAEAYSAMQSAPAAAPRVRRPTT
jgi:hypothetical protein